MPVGLRGPVPAGRSFAISRSPLWADSFLAVWQAPKSRGFLPLLSHVLLGCLALLRAGYSLLIIARLCVPFCTWELRFPKKRLRAILGLRSGSSVLQCFC